MKNINIYIITCDKTKHVLKAAIPLMEKYWNVEKHVKILGFNGGGIELPNCYEFVSMKPVQSSINDWARDIYSIIINDPNEHVIFLLDDMLVLDYMKEDIFNLLLDKCRYDKNIVRCSLCCDLQFLPCFVSENLYDYSIVDLKQNSEYRISTQPSIWRKDYLCDILSKSKDPWHFETAHPANDGKRIIGTRGKYACTCMGETALSNRYPGKFNVLGLKLDDVKWLVEIGAIDEKTLQFGMYLGQVPEFSKHKYDFSLKVLQNYVANNGQSPYSYYLEKYGHNYI